MSGAELARWSALRTRAGRDATGTHAVAGVRFVVAAVDRGADVAELLVAPALLRSPVGQMVARRLRREGVPVTRVDADTFARTFPEREPQGIAAILRHRVHDERALAAATPDALYVAVESVRSAGNLGSTMRTAAAVGATGIVALSPELDLLSPDTVRAAMGSTVALDLVACPIDALRAAATRHRVRLVGATPDARRDYRRVDWTSPTVLVIGAERRGLSTAQRRACDALVSIPMHPRVDSLNLAVATSILLYEAYSQRHPLAGRQRG